jgi:hypothetical protein
MKKLILFFEVIGLLAISGLGIVFLNSVRDPYTYSVQEVVVQAGGSPARVHPSDQILLRVGGFGPHELIKASLALPDGSYGNGVIAGRTDAAGVAELRFIMPANWPDGQKITQENLVLQVSNQDASLLKSAGLELVY